MHLCLLLLALYWGACGYIGLDYIPSGSGGPPFDATTNDDANPTSGPANESADANDHNVVTPDANKNNAGDTNQDAQAEPGTLFPFSEPEPWESADGTATLTPGGEALTLTDAQPFPDSRAVNFANDGYLVLAADPRWELSSGSVSLYFRSTSCEPSGGNDFPGFVSRDAFGSANAGHLTIGYGFSSACTLETRLQPQDAEGADDGRIESTTEALPNVWHHVGVNFGPGGFELWLNGTLEAALTEHELGIDGNQNPWVIGAHSKSSGEGSATPVGGFFQGEIALLRISDQRQDFSTVVLP